MDTDSNPGLKADFTVENEFAYVSKPRVIKNLLVLSLGFLLLFSSFMALANLQSTMNNIGSIGVQSQSAIYGALIVSSFLFPKLIIRKLGCKLTLGFSMIAYSPYVIANFHPTMATLLPTAILLGACGATLWSASGTYINELSMLDARGDIEKATLSTSKFFGIFLMAFQTTQIWGNLVSFYVLKPPDTTIQLHSNTSENDSAYGFSKNVSCGAEFCGGIDQQLLPLPDEKRFMLIGIFLAFSITAAIVIFLFLDSLKYREETEDENGLLAKLAATFDQMKKVDQLLLIVLTTFSGLEQGFVFGDYSEAYVACTLGLDSVGLVFVCFGITSATTSFFSGRLVKYVPRGAMLAVAATSNFCVCITLFVWKPNSHHTWSFYVIVAFWGFSDATWQTQLNTLYGVLFRSNEEAAFANYRLFEALGYLIAFSCSGYVCMSSKIYMQIGFLVVGMMGYVVLEVRILRRKKNVLLLKRETCCMRS